MEGPERCLSSVKDACLNVNSPRSVLTYAQMLMQTRRRAPARRTSELLSLFACVPPPQLCRQPIGSVNLGKISILQLTLHPFEGYVLLTFISQRVCKLINIFFSLSPPLPPSLAPPPPTPLLQANICFLRSERGQTFLTAPYAASCQSSGLQP